MKLEKLFAFYKERYNENLDIKFVEFSFDGIRLGIVYQEYLGNINTFNKDYLGVIRLYGMDPLDSLFPGIAKKMEDYEEVTFEKTIFRGDIVVFDYLNKEIYAFDLNNIPDRSISDSIAGPSNIYGSRDGLVESYKTNLALIRTRVKLDELEITEYYLGKRSKTKVGLLRIKGIKNDIYEKKIKKVLNKIDVDSILSIPDIGTFFSEKYSIVPAIYYSGNPEFIAKALFDGQFVLLIDRVPVVILMPMSVFFLTKITADMQTLSYYAFFVRVFVIISLFLSVFLPGLIACFLTYQSDNLSLIFLSTLKLTQKGVIFPTQIEILIILFFFELYSIIGGRTSSLAVQIIVAIVGGILIGQNTVESGLVGIVVMVLVGLSYLSTYLITNNMPIYISISYLRFGILLFSSFFGLYGFMIGAILTITILYNTRSLGVSFLHPFVPLNYGDIKRFFLPRGSKNYKRRPDILKPRDTFIKGGEHE